MYEPDGSGLAHSERAVRYTVVGVVRSVRLEDLSGRGNPEGAYYFPYSQRTSNNYTIAVDLVDEDGTFTSVDTLNVTVKNVAP